MFELLKKENSKITDFAQPSLLHCNGSAASVQCSAYAVAGIANKCVAVIEHRLCIALFLMGKPSGGEKGDLLSTAAIVFKISLSGKLSVLQHCLNILLALAIASL